MPGWNNLPVELLHLIVNYLHNEESLNAKDIAAIQLVCKSWSKVAQKSLYHHVELSRNATLFATTVKQAPHLGALVSTITFLKHYNTKADDFKETVHRIFQYCRNIKEIQACGRKQHEDIWPLLVSRKYNKIKRLEKLLVLDDSWRHVDASVYDRIALRYKKSMTHLQLSGRQTKCNKFGVVQVIYYQDLKEKLDLFPSLQQLSIAELTSKPRDPLAEFIDGCSPTLHELYFGNLWAYGVSPTNITRPNTSVKTMEIRFATFSSEILQYFTVKLRALEELKASFYEFSATDAWWHQLASIGSTLKKYTFGIKYQDGQRTRSHYLQQCVNVARNSVPSTCRKIVKVMYCYDEGEFDRFKMNIVMRKSTGLHCLEIDQRTPGDYSLPDLIQSLQLYLPDAVHLVFEHVQTPKHWIVLNHFLDLLDPAKEQSFCIENLSLTTQFTLNDSNAQTIADMTFKQTTFAGTVLPTLSKRIQKIDRLVFDSCSLLKDKHYNLNIFLPDTSIFELKLVSPSCSEEYSYLKKGNYTVRIETDNRIYASKRQAGKIVEQSCDNIAEGTEDNFLIWIKCKSLERFLLTYNPLNNSFE